MYPKLHVICLVFTGSLERATSINPTEISKRLGENKLSDQITSHPDVVDDYFPDIEFERKYNKYRVSYPDPEDFVIGLLVNPCGVNGTHHNKDSSIPLGYDCCMNHYGRGEYGYKKYHDSYHNGQLPMNKLEIFKRRIPAGVNEPLHNIVLVDEKGGEISYESSRRADDHTMIDESCVGLRDPHLSCIRDRLRAEVSPFIPSCWDHNQTVDSTQSCYTPEGVKKSKCMQVSYAQNSFIHVCGGKLAKDERCGTFIEIHVPNGSPYENEETVIAEKKITSRETSGMTTTTIPLTYKNNNDRVLCSYIETKIRIGSMVRITEDSIQCCCPAQYNKMTKLGSFFCPLQSNGESGPFANKIDSVMEHLTRDHQQSTYPSCHALEENKDTIICSKEIVSQYKLEPEMRSLVVGKGDLFYTENCHPLNFTSSGRFTSPDLHGEYETICQLGDAFQGCGGTHTNCIGMDHKFSFRGKMGKVSRLPRKEDDTYGVTFNDGRTEYAFPGHHLELQSLEANYELWFVQRNRFEKILQKKKGFRVVWPRCTYDLANDQYLPFAELDSDGNALKITQNENTLTEQKMLA